MIPEEEAIFNHYYICKYTEWKQNADNDSDQDVIVSNTRNKVYEIWLNTSLGEQGVLTQWHAIAINDSAFTPPHWEGIVIEDTPGGVVGIAGYYSENDKGQHVIVGTKDGNVYDFSLISHL